MRTALPLILRPWKLVLLLVFAAIAGCSDVSPPDAKQSHDLDRQMFTAGYEGIDQYYVRKPDLRTLTIGGLSSLSAIDHQLSVAQEDGKLDLDYGGKTAATFIADGGLTADDWAELTTNAVAAARNISPVVAKADSEAIYKSVFSGMVGRRASGASASTSRSSTASFASSRSSATRQPSAPACSPRTSSRRSMGWRPRSWTTRRSLTGCAGRSAAG
jgi:hypothetical protein